MATAQGYSGLDIYWAKVGNVTSRLERRERYIFVTISIKYLSARTRSDIRVTNYLDMAAQLEHIYIYTPVSCGRVLLKGWLR